MLKKSTYFIRLKASSAETGCAGILGKSAIFRSAWYAQSEIDESVPIKNLHQNALRSQSSKEALKVHIVLKIFICLIRRLVNDPI